MFFFDKYKWANNKSSNETMLDLKKMMAFAIVELILKCWRELPCGVSKPVRALRFAFDGNQLGRFGRLSIFEVAPVAIDHKMRTKKTR